MKLEQRIEIDIDEYEKVFQSAFKIEFLSQKNEITEMIILTSENIIDNYRFIRQLTESYEDWLYPDIVKYDFTVNSSELFKSNNFNKNIIYENNNYDIFISEENLRKLRENSAVKI